MMTPQEVSSHAFAKATFGGYNMAMVDEFLDQLTEDYTTLFNDNAILKNKLKTLTETLEEYRATDNAMRKTLLAAQQMAETMVKDAEAKRDIVVQDAEKVARQRVDELRAQIAAEEYRLKSAKEATAAFVAKVSKLYGAQGRLLEELDKLAPAAGASEAKAASAAEDIEHNLNQMLTEEEEAPAQAAPKAEVKPEPKPEPKAESKSRFEIIDLTPPAPVAEDEEDEDDGYTLNPEATRRFEDLKFGKDYEIR